MAEPLVDGGDVEPDQLVQYLGPGTPATAHMTTKQSQGQADELPALIEAAFPIAVDARGIFGHSMGGHGALSLALAHPGHYQSVSAFAPIVAPSQVPWGQKAFTRYLGADRAAWARYDTVELLKTRRFDGVLRVDQGEADQFLARELRPELLEAACRAVGQPLELQRRAGYDHSYYFIATFMDEHLAHHARALGCG